MNRPTPEEFRLLQEFAEVGVMSPERRLALGRLLEAYEDQENALERALGDGSLMASRIQQLKDSAVLLQDEVDRIRQFIEVQEATLNEARTMLDEAQRRLVS